MKKKLTRLAIPAILLIGLVVFAGTHQVVRTEGGWHFIQKKDFGFGETVIDTRDWGLSDWVKNKDIGLALADVKVQELQDQVTKSWDRFSDKMDDWVNDAKKNLQKENVSRDLEKLREDTEREYRKLAKKLENQKIDSKEFEKKMKELEDWFQKKVDSL